MKISFQLNSVETKLGQNVYLIGEDKSLGKWDRKQAHQLYTSEKTYPTWETSQPIKINLVNAKNIFEYKYIIQNDDFTQIKWEDGANRMVDLNDYYKDGVVVHIKLTDEGFGMQNISKSELEQKEEYFQQEIQMKTDCELTDYTPLYTESKLLQHSQSGHTGRKVSTTLSINDINNTNQTLSVIPKVTTINQTCQSSFSFNCEISKIQELQNQLKEMNQANVLLQDSLDMKEVINARSILVIEKQTDEISLIKKEYNRKIMPLETLYDIFIEQEDNYPSEQVKLDEQIKENLTVVQKENLENKKENFEKRYVNLLLKYKIKESNESIHFRLKSAFDRMRINAIIQDNKFLKEQVKDEQNQRESFKLAMASHLQKLAKSSYSQSDESVSRYSSSNRHVNLSSFTEEFQYENRDQSWNPKTEPVEVKVIDLVEN